MQNAAACGRAQAHYDGGMGEIWGAIVWGLIPTIVVAGLFAFVIRSILRMDRTERKLYAQVEAEERLKRGLPPRDETAGRSAHR
ncbi:hypothetical protein BWL13_00273 [Microbacterium oleivorans]|uniref:Putative membrane protein n=2 Tax=Microbacterium oleivorans TaxID=273677 RepID=A0A031FXR2_9MICO|nr:hypothetical protein BWL13_00273 [Microbacterium oleivorans]EZP28425.1 putative membrane protein [Microbacterium oleivorans]